MVRYRGVVFIVFRFGGSFGGFGLYTVVLRCVSGFRRVRVGDVGEARLASRDFG